MFVAPVLYVLHAILTGISVFIAASMHWIAGFGFSAGLVDMVLSSRNPLATHWYMLIPQGLVFFVIYYVVFRFTINKFNLMTRAASWRLPVTKPTVMTSTSTATPVKTRTKLPRWPVATSARLAVPTT